MAVNPKAGEALLGLGGGRPAGVGSRYSSVSHEPREWTLEPDRPCSGERMLLMFDRWQKLHKSFYSEKKDTFDISKVSALSCARRGGPLCGSAERRLGALQRNCGSQARCGRVVQPRPVGCAVRCVCRGRCRTFTTRPSMTPSTTATSTWT